jgi:hypothetical protein
VAVRKDLPAHAISIKNKHLLVIDSIPTRGFTAAVLVFRGTPPPKPLECKFWLNTIGALLCERRAWPIGGEPRLSCARFNFVSVDIIEMSPSFRSQIVHLSLLRFTSVTQGKQKTLLTLRQAGFGKILSFFSYLLTSGVSKFVPGACPLYDMDRPRLNTQPWLNRR